MTGRRLPRPSTFSIVATDPEAGEVGIGVQSKFLAAGALVPWARGGVGGVATQALADVSFGPRGLDLLAEGLSPRAVLDRLLEEDDQREHRQVGVVDAHGASASFTGSECFEHAASATGPGYACQGNILASDRVVPAMAGSFEGSVGRPLAERLVEALRAAQREGGDRRGMEAAGLVVASPGGGYGGTHDRAVDLRVDHHDDPIEELSRLLSLHRFYFERPADEDLIAADATLEGEIARMLTGLGRLEPGRDLWDALFDYMGWENLEERWAGRGRIDPRVLDHLRTQAGSGRSS
ncbi:MAG: DUF1028 domain-containing protein [Actinobacteria bacterium]|nr:DUF1028 domain-containing protein [Actinomycetota bacterium]